MTPIIITVNGPAGCGKTAVLAVIEKALIDHYGKLTQVASYDLAYARSVVMAGDVIDDAKLTGAHGSCENRMFILKEGCGK